MISCKSYLIGKSVLYAILFLLCSTQALSQHADRKPNSKISGVQVGVITYSYRSMPSQTLEDILQYVVRSGISAVELMGDPVELYLGRPAEKNKIAEWRATLPMERYKAVRKMFERAGVSIYAFKPGTLNIRSTDAEIEYALRAAKALGARSATMELPSNPKHTERIGKLAAKHKMYVGYHNHLQGNDEAWNTALSQSPYNSINLDCGHYIAAGGKNTKESLLAFIEANHKRITSMHLKDRKTKSNGSANLPWGEGDTPLEDILNLLKEKKYKIPVSIELEYAVPPGSDAVREIEKCFGYAKEILDK